MSTVVMAIDGTSTPLTVLPLYRSMAREPDRVILVHVSNTLPDPRQGGSTSGDQPDHALHAFRRELEKSCPARVTTLVRTGAFADEVLKVANEVCADVIIVGFNRAAGPMKLLMKCAVNEIERRATVPVIVGRRSIGRKSTPHTLNGRESYAA